MASKRLVRRITTAVGGGAIIAMIGFTAACGNESDTPEEPTTTTTTTTEPTVSPTEKAIDPEGPDVFTPTVRAPQPTVRQDRDDYGH